MTARGNQDSAGLPVLSKQKKPGDHEYDLSSVPDGKSLLSSMYVLSLAIYNLTACSHTVWGDQTQGNQHGPDVPVLSPGDHEYNLFGSAQSADSTISTVMHRFSYSEVNAV